MGQPVPALKDTVPVNTSTVDKQSHGLYTLTGNGIYVSGCIDDKQTSILLDTGTATSIINEEFWINACHSKQKELVTQNATLQTANGEPLVVQGQTTVSIRLGHITLQVNMLVVKDISHQCILGSDFFKDKNCQIRYDIGTFVFSGEEIPIHYQKSPPCVCRLIMVGKIRLDPETQIVTEARLEAGYERNVGSPGITEGTWITSGKTERHRNGKRISCSWE